MDETKMKEKENTVNEEITQENKETFSDGWGKIQRNAYQLTINNPAEHGLDHRTIKEILIKNFTTIEFFCMADEIGEQGTYHTHVYFYCSSRVRQKKVKKHFPTAHIEIALGTAKSNVEYIKKSGRWADTTKAETSVPNTYEEWGKMPRSKGKRSDMEELYSLIEAGFSNAEILRENNDFLLHIDKMDKIRQELLEEKYKNKRRLDLHVIYIYGATGKGKTRSVMDKYGDSAVYRVTQGSYKHPFDFYRGHEVIVFEEFRNSIPISDMLNYLDVYPLRLPARYNDKVACYTAAYIISNLPLEDQYKEVQKEEPETWKAFLRRIHEVYVYQEDGTIVKYPSVEEYMKRKEKFQTVKEEDACPFTEQQELPFPTDQKGGGLPC